MSTQSESKIKTARRPAHGDSYPCQACQRPICAGQQYFSYQSGQRSSAAYCLRCVRSRSGAVPCTASDLYFAKYGEITGEHLPVAYAQFIDHGESCNEAGYNNAAVDASRIAAEMFGLTAIQPGQLFDEILRQHRIDQTCPAN